MLQSERRERILRKLRQNNSVKITKLAKELGISESTMRRDINELDRMGKLQKVFGGAVAVGSDRSLEEADVAQKNLINIEEKEKIARYAAALIEDNDFVYIDAGTTTERMIDFLCKKNATYVTNGVSHGKKMAQKGLNVHIIGGLLRASTEAVIGEVAIETIKGFNFSKCFMGTNGIDTERGFTTPDIGEAAVKKAVIKQSLEPFILADHTKFDLITSVSFADIDEASIITDLITKEHYRSCTVIEEVRK